MFRSRASPFAAFLILTTTSTPPMEHASDFDTPPPLKPRGAPGHSRPYAPVLPGDDDPWVVPDELVERFADRALAYRAFASRFVCDESVDLVRYDGDGETTGERHWRQAYYLAGSGSRLSEERLGFRKDGSVGDAPAGFPDDRRFPPAYAWLLLFEENNRALVSFRHVEKRVEGYGLVHELHFRGGLPFATGGDIREWEGRLIVDAATSTPLAIVAEPRAQHARLQEAFRRYARSTKISIFGVLNFATEPEARGFRARIEFDHVHEGLRFPSRARYDTFALVSLDDEIAVAASTRSYDGYRFTEVEVGEERISVPPPN